MRNLPTKLTRDVLFEVLDSKGYGQMIDFIYIPAHFASRTNFGYAFVNFEIPEDAERCRVELQGFMEWPGFDWDKGCDVSHGDHGHGVESHIERYRNSPVMHDSVPQEHKPALYKAGQRLPFPGPTAAIKKPKEKPRRNKILGQTLEPDKADEKEAL